MALPVSSIPNLGPATEKAFRRVGITSADELRAIGPDEAYLRLLRNGGQPHFIGYYVLVMGLQGRPWNDCRGEEKAALRQRFDALKARLAQEGVPEGIERVLNEIGVGLRRAT